MCYFTPYFLECISFEFLVNYGYHFTMNYDKNGTPLFIMPQQRNESLARYFRVSNKQTILPFLLH